MWLPAEILTFHDVVRYWSQRTPDSRMLVEDRRAATYGQVEQRSNAIAQAVAGSGIAPGSHIGFLGKNSVEFWECWFGASKAGCALAPFNWRFAVAELVELVEDASVDLMIVSDEMEASARQVADRSERHVEIIVFDGRPDSSYEAWLAAQSCDPPVVAVPQAATVLLSYTSGTTGAPKGVQLTHRTFQYWFQISSMERSETWHQDDLFLTVMPNFHLAGTCVPLPCLYHGGALLIVPAFEPSSVLTAVTDRRPTMACLVPTAMQMLLSDPRTGESDLSSLRKIYYAGSAISPEVLRQAVETFGCELTQFYGTTETYIISLLRPEQHDPNHPTNLTSCGAPMPLIEVRIVDLDGHDVPDGHPGEVLVWSPTMFAGYWDKPTATREAFTEGWYRTGDIGRRDPDGNLHLIDRVKDMIITGGENVYSVEVERALTSHDAVAGVAVVGAPDERWGERIVAFVVARAASGPTTAEDLQQHCRELIASYKVPKQVHFVDDLPITASGKVQKNVLRDRLRDGEPSPRTVSP